MSRKIIKAIVVSLSVILTFGACDNRESNVKKVVLQTNISNKKDESAEETFKSEITIEEKEDRIEILDLGLEEGEFFYPSFYHEGELYGVITKGNGNVRDNVSEEFPIYGHQKEYIHKLGNNNILEETDKKTETMIGVGSRCINVKDSGKVLEIDYSNEDNSQENLELSNVIKELEEEYKYDISWNIYEIGERYLEFNAYPGYSAHIETPHIIYDRLEKKLYESTEGNQNTSSMIYVEYLDSIIYTDETLTLHKVKFEGDHYCFEEYISLKEEGYTGGGIVESINDYEILVTETQRVNDVYRGPERGKNKYEIARLSKYNFKLNQYTTLFEKKEGINVYAHYIGENIILLEEFEIDPEDKRYMIGKNRYFYEIVDNKLELLLKDNIEDEGKSYTEGTNAILSEDGKTVFVSKFNNKYSRSYGIWTEEAFYKRYKIK